MQTAAAADMPPLVQQNVGLNNTAKRDGLEEADMQGAIANTASNTVWKETGSFSLEGC